MTLQSKLLPNNLVKLSSVPNDKLVEELSKFKDELPEAAVNFITAKRSWSYAEAKFTVEVLTQLSESDQSLIEETALNLMKLHSRYRLMNHPEIYMNAGKDIACQTPKSHTRGNNADPDLYVNLDEAIDKMITYMSGTGYQARAIDTLKYNTPSYRLINCHKCKYRSIISGEYKCTRLEQCVFNVGDFDYCSFAEEI